MFLPECLVQRTKLRPLIFKQLSELICTVALLILFSNNSYSQKLQLNDLGYFETPGVNIFVYSNQYTGMFNDEKNAGIEIIHHGVRTSTGGAVRLQNTPEQWDLVPTCGRSEKLIKQPIQSVWD